MNNSELQETRLCLKQLREVKKQPNDLLVSGLTASAWAHEHILKKIVNKDLKRQEKLKQK